MKRSIFTVIAVLTLLLAAPVVAQQEEPYESRTNPDARSIAPGSGLTITGTVVESNDKQLVITSTTGVQHIQILPNTEMPVGLEVGQGVSVDYTRTSQGVMIAQKVRTEGVAGEAIVETSVATTDTSSSLVTETETEAELDDRSDLSVSADLDADVETTTADTDLQAGVDSDLDGDASFDESLPATGSNLPLVALLGLVGMAGALVLRSIR
jgi:LPXTG-motif cell wall-anchored protein